MKRVLMRTHNDRYFNRPGVKFTVPDEVAEELERLDRRKFQIVGDVEDEQKAPEGPPRDKRVKGRTIRRK